MTLRSRSWTLKFCDKAFLLKVFVSVYLLNVLMDQVDTLHIDRYWSGVLFCTIMIHLRSRSWTPKFCDKVFLVKVFVSVYLLNVLMDQVDTLHIDRYWSGVLFCTIMIHLRSRSWTPKFCDKVFLVKVFVSVYLLNVLMDQVDTLHIDRYWSGVLFCTIMIHLRSRSWTPKFCDKVFLVKVFVSVYLLNVLMDQVDTLHIDRYWSEVL